MGDLPLVDAEPHGGCVSRVPLFAPLTPAQQSVVGRLAEPIALAAGDVLARARTDHGQLFVVHSGRVKLVHTSQSGHDRVLRVVGPGQVVGEHAFLTGERPDYLVVALEPTRMCVFRHRELDGLVRQFPAIAQAMLRSLTTRLADAEHRLELVTLDVPARLAAYLLDLPAHHTSRGPVVTLPVTKKDVASLLSTTPESLSRALDRLTREHFIQVDDRRILLLDLDGLEQLVGDPA